MQPGPRVAGVAIVTCLAALALLASVARSAAEGQKPVLNVSADGTAQYRTIQEAINAAQHFAGSAPHA